MNQAMDVEESLSDASKFDELIESELKVESCKSSHLRQIATLSKTRCENKVDISSTGINIVSDEEVKKKEERAVRFRLGEKKLFSALKVYKDLYSSMGITEENKNTKNLRLNVLHMRGTEEMSTEDIFKYFEEYAPISLEWINDFSCNVIWIDPASAARALIGLTKRIIGLSNRSQIESSLKCNKGRAEFYIGVDSRDRSSGSDGIKIRSISDEKEIHIKDISYPPPPGIWRKGSDNSKSKAIFLRFATETDKMQPWAVKMSENCKKYGSPNFEAQKLSSGAKAISTESRKRILRQKVQTRNKFKKNVLDLNMKDKSKNPWGDLCRTWGVNDNLEEDFIQKYHVRDKFSSVKERLGSKNHQTRMCPISSESDSESEIDCEEAWYKKNKVLRMRMHADDEEDKVRRCLSHLNEVMCETSNDLRLKLGRTRQEPVRNVIQIHVSNPSIMNYETSKKDESEEEGQIMNSESDDPQRTGNREKKQEKDDEKIKEGVKGEGANNTDDKIALPVTEVRGPKGSVIKVVSQKPRLSSSVWSRLNRVKSEVKAVNNRQQSRRYLEETLRRDLRARLGNHTRSRSPLRIEVKNDKFADYDTDLE